MKKFFNFLIYTIILVIFMELIINIFNISIIILPKPSDVFLELFKNHELIFKNLLITMTEAFFGLFISIITAFILCYFIYNYKFLKKILYPLIIITQNIPFILLTPLITLWLGFNILSKVTIVSVVCFFPILISFLDGLYNISHIYIDYLTSLKTKKIFNFFNLKFIIVLPNLFAGIKIALSYSILSATISEWSGASKGLGILFINSTSNFNITLSYAITLVIISTTLILIYLIDFIKDKILYWL